MYTIQILQGGEAKRDRVINFLSGKLERDGRFRVKMTPGLDLGFPSIHLKPIRLIHPKPYCGQHPGECVVNPFLGPKKKIRATYLEWDDWVDFHNLVNRTLNQLRAHANVWSHPLDTKGKFWIRKDNRPRLRYEWEEKINKFGLPVRIWNNGTEDQFVQSKQD